MAAAKGRDARVTRGWLGVAGRRFLMEFNKEPAGVAKSVYMHLRRWPRSRRWWRHGPEKASTVSCFSVCNQNNQIQPRAGGGKRGQQVAGFLDANRNLWPPGAGRSRKRTRGGAKEQASRALPAALGAVADLASTVKNRRACVKCIRKGNKCAVTGRSPKGDPGGTAGFAGHVARAPGLTPLEAGVSQDPGQVVVASE